MLYDDYYSQPTTIPNSRIVPPIPDHTTNNVKQSDYRKQPARTSSLPCFERESFIDPTAHYFNDTHRQTYIVEDNNTLIENVYSQAQDKQSNIQKVFCPPIQVQHGYVDLPQPASAVIENTSANTKTSRKQPPLPPLVIPANPARMIVSTPTRTSSIPKDLAPLVLHTPGSLRTPESSRSPNTQDSPYTPHLIPSPLSKKGPAETEAESYLHQGIKYHEAGRLEEATKLFKQATDLGLPIAMFLFGISLRHGWGCEKNEYVAFQYLQKAAEQAVEDLTSLSSKVNMSAAKNELIMAIYELGVSFRHGWGCKKNKETAVYYFKIAADLNDPDAQNDLGHCYYHGYGVKKDLFLAAKYYRLADKQGQGIMGNSWIWKSKYDKKK